MAFGYMNDTSSKTEMNAIGVGNVKSFNSKERMQDISKKTFTI